MAAMIAMPALAFVLLMTMAVYEDRMLPRGNVAADPPERQSGEPPTASAPCPASGLVADPGLSGKRNCRVRHADARPVRRSHGPAVHRAGQATPVAPQERPAPVTTADAVPCPPPDPIPDVSGDVA